MGSQLVFETAFSTALVEGREVVKAFQERTDSVRFSHVSFHDDVGFAYEAAVEAVQMQPCHTKLAAWVR